MATTNLRFKSLREVTERLDLLLENGYERQGGWSLGQNCNHLATLMELTQRFGEMRLGRLFGKFGGPLLVLNFARMATALRLRIPTVPFARQTQPVEDPTGVERLKQAIQRQQCLVEARAFTTFEIWHCGHHLGFLTPNAERAPVSASDDKTTSRVALHSS